MINYTIKSKSQKVNKITINLKANNLNSNPSSKKKLGSPIGNTLNLSYSVMIQINVKINSFTHISNTKEKIHISFFEACFLILYFHACVCIYVAYMNKLVFKPKAQKKVKIHVQAFHL